MTVYNPRIVEKMRGKSDGMQIYGEVIVRQGRKIVARGRNKFVGQALISLCNHFGDVALGVAQTAKLFNLGNPATVATGAQLLGHYLTMRLGTDTVTATTKDMVTLVNILNVAPSSMSITRDNPSAGVWRAIYTATWNAGTVSGTVGELGLFCALQKTLGTSTITLMDVTQTLWSRLSCVDADFAQFVIDNTKPLSVEWRIVFQF